MNIRENFRYLLGRWKGSSSLWLTADEPVRESDTNATVDLAAGGRFVTLRYTWAEGGQPQDGVLLIGADGEGNVEAAWIDSWHMGDKMMVCQGRAGDKWMSFTGSYAAPPGPDWRWRFEIQTGESDDFELRMYNITPQGDEALAVRAQYWRLIG